MYNTAQSDVVTSGCVHQLQHKHFKGSYTGCSTVYLRRLLRSGHTIILKISICI